MELNYIGQRMIVDMTTADGNVFFDKEFFTFKPRDPHLVSLYTVTIYYRDIKYIHGRRGIKSTVEVVTQYGKYDFFVHKMNTLMELIQQGIDYSRSVKPDVVDADFTKKEEPLSNSDIDKLTKLSQLHKDGCITDAEFEKEKSLILNRK